MGLPRREARPRLVEAHDLRRRGPGAGGGAGLPARPLRGAVPLHRGEVEGLREDSTQQDEDAPAVGRVGRRAEEREVRAGEERSVPGEPRGPERRGAGGAEPPEPGCRPRLRAVPGGAHLPGETAAGREEGFQEVGEDEQEEGEGEGGAQRRVLCGEDGDSGSSRGVSGSHDPAAGPEDHGAGRRDRDLRGDGALRPDQETRGQLCPGHVSGGCSRSFQPRGGQTVSTGDTGKVRGVRAAV